MTKILKSLMLTALASTMIMAGGDISPVEPVVETPAVSGWTFGGQGVGYYQTNDSVDLFDQASSVGSFGVQLRADNDNLFYGFGTGIELTGLGTLGLQDSIISRGVQSADGTNNGGAITQAYLTYTLGNTVATVGRMAIDGTVSPFAYSEDWNVFKNTFEAATIVNTSIPDTTIVGGYVRGANSNADLSTFERINEDGVYLVTALNQSITGLDLTASYYYAADMALIGDTQIVWGSGEFTAYGADIGIQGGTVLVDTGDDTVGFGAKVGYDFGLIDTGIAYSNADDGTVGLMNLAGTNSVFYTNLLVNGEETSRDAETYMGKAGIDILGGNLSAAYAYTDSVVNFTEADVVYTTKLDNGISVFTGYIYTDDEVDTTHGIRAWARYNF